MKKNIVIKGARQHNLKNINLKIPRRAFTVITGLSGSGKSSLALDTIYAEGQRRYVASLSTYAKQFLERMPKPDVDYVEGISPSVSIERKNPTMTSRSTVGTATEINDYLRLLYARVGRTNCYQCGREVKAGTVAGVIKELFKADNGKRILVLFPLKVSEKVTMKIVAANLLALGFVRIMLSEDTISLDPLPKLRVRSGEEIFVIADRLILKQKIRSRLADSLQTAFLYGEGEIVIHYAEDGRRVRYSQGYRCGDCQIDFPNPTPQFFSFNNPYGACGECRGFGNILEFDPGLVVPDPDRTLKDGALDPWAKPRYVGRRQSLNNFCKSNNIPTNVPFKRLSTEQKRWLLYGGRGFIGVFPFLEALIHKKYKKYIRFFLRSYQSLYDCHGCDGTRLRKEVLNVRIAGVPITYINDLTISKAYDYFQKLELRRSEQEIAKQILNEIKNRLKFLTDVGVEYLTLSRLTKTLSGGEAQRVGLANSLGSNLVNTLYILDEPTIGLHSRDASRMINALKQLVTLGNTLLVVEHDRKTIESADHIIELGPGAGEGGGEVVFSGKLDKILSNGSLTGQYLKGERNIPLPGKRRDLGKKKIRISGAAEHNLKNIVVEFPLGNLIAVTGVSGSGKSTLVHNILFRSLEKKILGIASGQVGKHGSLSGANYIKSVVMVDQSPIGKTPRSNPVTYVKAFDAIRQVFANTSGAKTQGFSAGRFSFNVEGGRCEVCKGDGQVKYEMHFLADVYVPCDECQGKRYNKETLDVKYKGKDISEVLELTVNEAIRFFAKEPNVGMALWILQSVGLGYLRLGQPGTTLSGGEAQRLKIARELANVKGKRDKSKKGVLCILDEPTTGLHFHDIKKLVDVLNTLVDRGNTVIIIEHNLDVIKQADYIIDLGPDGGENGGRVVACGRPDDLMNVEGSYTGKYLRKVLKNKETRKPS